MTAAPSNERLTILKITVVAALGGLLFGYDTGVIGGSQLYFTEYFKFSAAEQGWAVSSALYGCLVGALIGGYLTKSISRKYTLILAAALFTVSAWGSGIADSLNELAIYRIYWWPGGGYGFTGGANVHCRDSSSKITWSFGFLLSIGRGYWLFYCVFSYLLYRWWRYAEYVARGA